MRNSVIAGVAIAGIIVVGAAGAWLILGQRRQPQPKTIQATQSAPTGMQITSSEFPHNGRIPAKYTCDGDNVNPPLSFANIPDGTKSLALIVDDPDAPAKVWVHWLVWNIPPDTKEVKEGATPSGAQEGITDFGREGWGGPCPPSGTHRYFFKLYALDTELMLFATVTKESLLSAMEGHILAQGELVGLYSRQ